MTDTIVNNVGIPNPQGKIAAALAKFQADIPQVVKDSAVDAGRMKYNFAPLDKITPIIFPLLAAQEVAYTAVPDWTELGFGLRAALIHSSGEKIEGFYPLGNPNTPAQAIGSAISYARRYALLSLTGVAPTGEDDDGASATVAQGNAIASDAPAAPAKETPESVRKDMGNTIETSGGLVGPKDANEILARITGGKSIEQWSLTDMKKARVELTKLLAERKAAQEAK